MDDPQNVPDDAEAGMRDAVEVRDDGGTWESEGGEIRKSVPMHVWGRGGCSVVTWREDQKHVPHALGETSSARGRKWKRG